jgi:hypothetical protein
VSVGEDVLQRLRLDYPFWAETVYKIRDKRNLLIPLVLNEVQQDVGLSEQQQIKEEGNARLYVLKARQGGISTDQQARSFHAVWGTPGTTALTLAHSREDTDKIYQITRRAVQNFPKELLPSMGRGEARELTFPDLDCHFWTAAAGSKRVGRGITLTRCHGSEFAFWEEPRGTLGSITPAMIPHGSTIVLETTPDRYGSPAHEFWVESEANQTGYTPLFFPWWKCDRVFYRLPLFDLDELLPLDDEEKALIQKHELDHEQIKWRRGKIKELGRSTFMREYPEDAATCWITGGSKFYDADMIAKLLTKAPTPYQVIPTPYGGVINLYNKRTYKTQLGYITEDVIIGSDVAEGSGGDGSTFTARAFPSWRLLAQFKSNKIIPEDLADLLVYWGREFGEALLVVEKNFHGITTLRRIKNHHQYPRSAIFHRTPLDKNHDVKTDYIGWATTNESKPLMLDYGREILKASDEGFIPPLSREVLVDAWAVTDGVLTGRDTLVSEILCWVGREYQAKRKVSIGRPVHW